MTRTLIEQVRFKVLHFAYLLHIPGNPLIFSCVGESMKFLPEDPVKRTSTSMTIITGVWLLLLILAPLTLPANSLYLGDSGGANRMDFQDVWSGMPLFQRAIYTIGDFNCHQMSSRSFFLNGNQMPFCSRDIGVFSGFVVGSALVSLLGYLPNLYESLFHPFPKKMRKRFLKRPRLWAVMLGSFFVLPLVLDGTVQMLTAYESNNTVRFITGIFAGTGVMVYTGAFVVSARAEIERLKLFAAQYRDAQ